MHKLKHLKIPAMALVLSLCLVSAPALAVEQQAPETRKAAAEQTTVAPTGDDAKPDDGSQTELRKRGVNLADDMRKQQKTSTKTAEVRKKQCEAHKQGLINKFSRITANSQKIKTHIDSVLTKTQAYQQANGVAVADYESLVAAAETAKAAAADSIVALQAVTPTLDCNNTSTASDVATFKAATQDTRDKLKAYRTAVKTILKTLHQAKPATNENTEGSN